MGVNFEVFNGRVILGVVNGGVDFAINKGEFIWKSMGRLLIME